jgi:Patatin-like phospholipase
LARRQNRIRPKLPANRASAKRGDARIEETERTSMTQTGQNTAFVFAGGGSLGAIQVGMLRVLLSVGMQPDFVIGSSVGAINASYFAGAPNEEGVETLAKIWSGMRGRDVFPFTFASPLGRIEWQLIRDLERLPGEIHVSIVPPLCPLDVSPYDFSASRDLIQRAVDSTRQWADHGGLSRQSRPEELQAHSH